MRPNLRLRHMGMYVWDIERMATFYQEVLGFIQTDKGFVRGRATTVRGEKIFILKSSGYVSHMRA